MAEFFESYAIWGIWIIFGLIFLTFLVMAPCHAIFLLPFVGLPMFWLLPLGYALLINIAAWLAILFLYWAIRRTMKKPVTSDGFQSLVGTETKVVSKVETGYTSRYLVRAQGELWSAYSTDTLQPGEAVNITAVKGIGFAVERVENSSHSGQDSNTKTTLSEEKDNKQHYH